MKSGSIQHEYEPANALAIVLVGVVIRVDVSLDDVGFASSRETDVLSPFEVAEDVLSCSNVRWSWVGHGLQASADGVSGVRPCASSDVHERADELLIHLGVIRVGDSRAVVLGELDVWYEQHMLDFAVCHVK